MSAHPAISSSTIPLTSGIEEAPQLLLSVDYIFTISRGLCASRIVKRFQAAKTCRAVRREKPPFVIIYALVFHQNRRTVFVRAGPADSAFS
jgi:hypothetical protein